MAKLAFLGLGLMGTPIAARLLEAGHDLTVWNRTSGKTRPLVDQGASAASSPADAVAGADAVFTMVATPEALEQVLFGDEGVVGALSPGQRLIDMSTVGPQMIASVAAAPAEPRHPGRRPGPRQRSRSEHRPARDLRRGQSGGLRLRPAAARPARQRAPRGRTGRGRRYQGCRQPDTRRRHHGPRRGPRARRHARDRPYDHAGRPRRLADRTHRPRQARQHRVRHLPAQLQAEPGPQGSSPGRGVHCRIGPGSQARRGVAELARTGGPGRSGRPRLLGGGRDDPGAPTPAGATPAAEPRPPGRS